MGMTHDECVLMAALSRVTKQAAAFALEFVEGDMPATTQITFAQQLGLVAQQLREHAQQQLRTIDGEVLDTDTDALTQAGGS